MTVLMGESPSKRSAGRDLKIAIPAALVTVALLAAIAVHSARPLIKERAVQLLSEKFQGEVQIKDLEVSVLPTIRVRGSGLQVRYQGRSDVPPVLQVREFTSRTSVLKLLGKPWKIDQVELRGLVIQIPPRDRNSSTNVSRGNWARIKDMPVLVRELVVDDGRLEVLPRTLDKPPHIFEIHHVVMHYVGLHHPASFTAQLSNARPPGEIETAGEFGPWNPDDPGETRLSADYTLVNADLGVFKGIAGTLSSKGKFHGVLNRIEVEGETDTPDFSLRISGHPLPLHTDFSATVDGLNGNTFLHPVRAHLLNSFFVASGEVAGKRGVKGKTIKLNVFINNGKIEDMLRLAVKSQTPAMTGNMKLHSEFDLPAGEGDIIERLRLRGVFGVRGAQFTGQKLSAKVETLSRKGLGKPNDSDAGSGVSELTGKFGLRNAKMTFEQLRFAVAGASVQLRGSYGLQNEALDFHGHLRLDAKLSQTITGFKSRLVKPFDSLFRKQGVTEIPIKITGTRDRPSFGLDFDHKPQQQ
jgi:autotransporter translocation and assembly factor TamB